MLNLNNTTLLIIDVQERLVPVMLNKEKLLDNLQRLIKGANVLELPIIYTEQVPEKLGPTLPEIADLLNGTSTPISKSSFSCYGCSPFVQQLEQLGRKQVLVAGIETHVCVYQTAIDLLEQGYEIQLVTDAVSSRTVENRQLAIDRMKEAGAKLTSTEMALFELLRVAEGDKFRQVSRIVK